MHSSWKYRDLLKGVQILLSNSQAGPGRTVKQEQEEISRNHVQEFIPGSVYAAGGPAEIFILAPIGFLPSFHISFQLPAAGDSMNDDTSERKAGNGPQRLTAA